MLIELLFLQIIVILFVALFIFKFTLLEPIILYNIGWLTPLIIVSAGIFKYENFLILESFLIISMCLWAFSAGTFLGKFSFKASIVSNRFFNISVSLWKNKIWQKIALISLFVYLVVTLGALNERIPLSSLLSANLTYLRSLHWENFGKDLPGIFSLLKSVTRPFVTISAISLALYGSVIKKKRFLFIAVLSLFVLSIETLGQGGRFLLAFVILCFLYTYLFIKFNGIINVQSILTRKNSKLALVAIIALIFIYGFVIVFPGIRNPNLTANFNFFLARSAPVSLAPFGEKLIDIFGNQAYSAFTGLSYFSNPISSLTLYYQHSDFTEWFYWGAYNFPIFSKVINLAQGNVYDWHDIRTRLTLIPSSLGHSPNPWSTGIRDLLIDFGEFGTIVFMFLFGILSQAQFIKTKTQPTDINLVLLSLLSAIILCFAFFGMIYNGFFMYPAILLFLFNLMKKSAYH